MESKDGEAVTVRTLDTDQLQQPQALFDDLVERTKQLRFEEKYIGGEPDDDYIERLCSALTTDACARLLEHGYVVIDGALGVPEASALRQEIQWLHKSKLTLPNRTAYVDAKQANSVGALSVSKLLEKPHIFEAEMEPAIRAKVPRLNQLYTKGIPLIERTLAKRLPSLDIYSGDASIKVQCNTGQGGCFPLHFDGPGGTKDSRRVTMLVYLNPDWQPKDGGHIRLLPFMQPPVNVAPLMDRMVLFLSDKTLHRVLPSAAPRYCLTVWLHGRGLDPGDDGTDEIRVKGGDPQDIVQQYLGLLERRPVQRMLSKVLHQEEWAQSIRECHGQQGELLLDSLKGEVENTLQQPAWAAVVSLIKDVIKTHKTIDLDQAVVPRIAPLQPPVKASSDTDSNNASASGASSTSSAAEPPAFLDFL